MTRHHFVLGAVAAIVVAGTILAEAKPGERRSHADGRAELNLTDDQRTALKSLDSDMKTQLDDIRAQVQAGDLSWEEGRTEAQGIRESFRENRQSVLTSEQLQVLEERRADGSGRGRGHGQRGGEPFGDVGLSESQGERLKGMREEHRAGMDALRESGDATREDLRQLRETQRQEIDGILTDEQRQTLEQKRAERGSKGEGRGRRGGGGGRRGGRRAR